MIEDIGPKLDGAVELDASGCVVAPGFIDIHTHFDAQVFWDRRAQAVVVPRGDHGGGGQLRLLHRPVPSGAPRRDRAHARERGGDGCPTRSRPGSPGSSRRSPSTSTWCGRRGTTLNFTAYIGHTALRLYVMGDAAYERAATPEEIERMCQLVGEAMAGRGGRPVHQLLVRPPGRRRQAGAEPVRRDGRGRGAVHGGGEGRQGSGAHHARLAVRVPGHLHLAARGRPARSPARCSPCPAGSTVRSSSCTRRPWPAGPTSGPRSRRVR